MVRTEPGLQTFAAWRPWLWLAATAAYWCSLAVLTHMPLKDTRLEPSLFRVPHFDKIVHGTTYAVLAALLSQTVATFRSRRAPVAEGSWRPAIAVGICLAVYGALDELTQPAFGRYCDVWDFAVDLVGVAVGIVAQRWVTSRTSRDASVKRNDH